MEFAFVIVGFAVMAIIIVAAAIHSQKVAEARRQALAQFAASNGFDYRSTGLSEVNEGNFWESLFGGGPGSEESRFIAEFNGFQFRPFGLGHSQTVDNLMTRRKDNVDWYVFDYTYKVTTSSGKSTSTTTYRNSIVALRLPVILPNMVLSPESFFNRIGEVFGRDEVKFESEEFNQRYFVQCSNSKLSYDLLHPMMIEYLLSIPTHTWQMAGPFLLIFERTYLDVPEYSRLIEDVHGFVQRIPDYVVEDRGFQHAWSHPLDQMGGN